MQQHPAHSRSQNKARLQQEKTKPHETVTPKYRNKGEVPPQAAGHLPPVPNEVRDHQLKVPKPDPIRSRVQRGLKQLLQQPEPKQLTDISKQKQPVFKNKLIFKPECPP